MASSSATARRTNSTTRSPSSSKKRPSHATKVRTNSCPTREGRQSAKRSTCQCTRSHSRTTSPNNLICALASCASNCFYFINSQFNHFFSL